MVEHLSHIVGEVRHLFVRSAMLAGAARVLRVRYRRSDLGPITVCIPDRPIQRTGFALVRPAG